MRTMYALLSGAVVFLILNSACLGGSRSSLTLMGYVPEKQTVSVENSEMTITEKETELNFGKIVMTSNSAYGQDIQVESKGGYSYHVIPTDSTNITSSHTLKMSLGSSENSLKSDIITLQISDT